MPIHKQGSGYQWGNHGKVYRGPGAKKKAEAQAAAAHANGFHESQGGIIHGASPKSFKHNVEHEMDKHPGKSHRAQDLAVAYSVQKEAKKKRMAQGGDVEKGKHADNHAYNYDDTQSAKGVNKVAPVYNQTENRMEHGNSEGGLPAKRAYGPSKAAKRHHEETLSELRSMPKPKLEGLARGGEVEHDHKELERKMSMRQPKHAKLSPKKHANILHGKTFKVRSHDEEDEMPKMAEGGKVQDDMGSEDERLAEHDRPSHEDPSVVSEEMGAKPEEDGEHVPAAHEDLSGPPEDEYMADHDQLLAHGGEAHSIVDRIMQRRRMAEGGQVDIDENEEEQPNEFYEQNEAAMKENYDEAMDDIDEGHSPSIDDPEESREENEDDADMISQIRRRMKSRR